MDFSRKSSVPVIELSLADLKPGTAYWVSTREQVRSAFEFYGCFEAVCDELEHHQGAFRVLEDLFSLPKGTKIKHTGEQPFGGYSDRRPNPCYESFAIKDVLAHEAVQNFARLMWPHGNSHFSEAANSYIQLAAEIEHVVRRLVYESYGVEKKPPEPKESIMYNFRATKYGDSGRLGSNEKQLAFDTHTDKTLVTVTHQNQVNGLEIQLRNGEWIVVTPSASSFTVLVGEGLMAWSNGRLYSPPHRVMMSGPNLRYFMGLFSFSKKTVKVPCELVDDEHPLKYKPFDHLGLPKFARSTREGLFSVHAIDAYCGV